MVRVPMVRDYEMPHAVSDLLQLVGLGLNVLGSALIFFFGYPPRGVRRETTFMRAARSALLMVFCGFLLQFVALLGHW
jgi:hypothetical protein